MEDVRSTDLPTGSSDGVDDVGPPRCRAQRTNFPDRIYYLSKEGERYVCRVSRIYVKIEMQVWLAEALAASVVKVAGRDVLATWKILISLGVAPLLYSFYALLATAVVVRVGAPLRWRIYTPLLVMISLPFIGYAALKFGEAGMDLLK